MTRPVRASHDKSKTPELCCKTKKPNGWNSLMYAFTIEVDDSSLSIENPSQLPVILMLIYDTRVASAQSGRSTQTRNLPASDVVRKSTNIPCDSHGGGDKGGVSGGSVDGGTDGGVSGGGVDGGTDGGTNGGEKGGISGGDGGLQRSSRHAFGGGGAAGGQSSSRPHDSSPAINASHILRTSIRIVGGLNNTTVFLGS